MASKEVMAVAPVLLLLYDRIFIWDYVIQFANLVSPFPNLRVLAPNVLYFVDHHPARVELLADRASLSHQSLTTL
jgi:hypothetical protein